MLTIRKMYYMFCYIMETLKQNNILKICVKLRVLLCYIQPVTQNNIKK